MVLDTKAEVDLSSLERDLCLSCLGRLFAKIGYGLTNYERGHSIKLLIQSGILSSSFDLISHLHDNFAVKSPSHPEKKGMVPETSIECYVCGGITSEVPKFAQIVMDGLKDIEFETFQVGTRIDPQVTACEEQLWAETRTTHQETLKAEMNREIGKLVSAETGWVVELATPDVVAVVNTGFDHVDVQISPIFIYGRYRKLKRGIPQTKWFCRRCRGRGCPQCDHTGKQYAESVGELIAAPVLKATGGSDDRFHGMGREDIDARMLGTGRPFVLEITRPRKRNLDLEELAGEINRSADSKVEVSELEWTSRAKVKEIKQSRSQKRYQIKISFSKSLPRQVLDGAVEALSGKEVEQRTPRRVAHRRADLVRKRKVHSLTMDGYDEDEGKWAVFTIKGDAGLYVKELFHSDAGRTTPSFAQCLEINSPLDITVEYLDVVEVYDVGLDE